MVRLVVNCQLQFLERINPFLINLEVEMKKGFISFAVASLALFAQSATVDWTSGDLSDAILGQSDIKSITAYYYVLSDQTALESAYNQSGGYTTQDLQQFFNDDGTLAEGVTASAQERVEVDMSKSPKQANYTQSGVTEDEYILAVYVAKSTYGGSYALASVGYVDIDRDSVVGSAGENDPGYNVSSSYVSGMGADAYAYESTLPGGGWTAVPEPTTVALLALGLAAVGMKRKVA